MGLCVSHGCFSGPYSSFGRFREALACAAGSPLPLMAGFDYDARKFLLAHGGGIAGKIAAATPIAWSTLAPDPIHALLDHSDCDGQIKHADLLSLACRLEDLAAKMRMPSASMELRDHADDAMKFALGCHMAHAAGECLTFS
mgnify:CR=1 FL=1